MIRTRILLAGAVVAAIALFYILDLGHFLSLDYLNEQMTQLQSRVESNPAVTATAFFLVYVIATGLSLPGAAILTLASGALFGLWWGTLLVSFASTIGATLAFLTARFLLRTFVERRFRYRLDAINRGINKDGLLYLFTLRLVPVFPFFVINLVMGVTRMRVLPYYLISQAGMLPATLIYVNAGTQLGRVDSLGGILSPTLLGSFVLLGLFPLLARWTVSLIQARRIYKGWPRPRRFDRNLVVIGAGSAGLVSAYIAATVRASVTLIERERMGGDCLNTGCVPSKALIRTARFLSDVKRAKEFGVHTASAEFDFGEVMDRIQTVIREIAPHDSVERYTALGVDCVAGDARITSPWTVEVGGRVITTRSIVIATGARPLVPPIPGLAEVDYLTSDTLWGLRELPKRLVVLGGGPVGSELTQCFARLGSQVTQVEMAPRLLMREDREVSNLLRARFEAEGVRVLTSHRAIEIKRQDNASILVCEHNGEQVHIAFDRILVAVGRTPNTEGFGLQELGVPVTDRGTIAVDDYLQTRFPNIYACGDVVGPYQFTHTAAHQAWFASVNALFSVFRRFKVDYSVIPWATFTEPEVARVGLNEQEAEAQGIACEITRYGIDDLDRAIADSAAQGFVKVLTEPGRDRILGVTIVGEHAGELITEYITAMKHRIGMNKILGTIHIYPTLSEANKFAAGEWKKAHAPEGALRLLGRMHQWRRGKSAASRGEARAS
ncbi:MAG: FAD-dependent oxidoreductase [Aquisalimonadaceae bacterium]